MDGNNFDALTKKLARATSRRSFFKGLIGGGAAVVGGSIAALPEADAQSSNCQSFHTTGQGCNDPPGKNCCATDLCIGDNINNPGAGKCGTCPSGSTFCPNPSHPGFCCSDATQACVGGECCNLPTCPVGQACGSVTNNCGTIGCGTCPGGQTCNASGQCVCLAEDPTTTCAGKCGTVNNNCGTPVNCGNTNCQGTTDPCLQVACNGNTCGFAAANENGPCDDGDICTTGDHCVAGSCVGTPVVCNTPPDAQCNLPEGDCNANGGCDYTPVQNNTSCGRCQVCTAGECGYAGSGTDPNNDCGTCQQCDGEGSCENAPDGLDYGDCATGEICCGGLCQAGPNCGCDTDADCAYLTSDTACQVGVCNTDGVTGTCGTEPAATTVLCHEAGDSATCDPAVYCDGEPNLSDSGPAIRRHRLRTLRSL